jgi:hypothetical protein
MHTILKVSAAGALAFGAVSAHAAIASPSGSSSDAILFGEVVSGSTVIASYAGDTGITLSALSTLPTTGTTVLAGDTNLTKLFAADGTGDTLVWGVLGGQGAAGSNPLFVTTTAGSSTTNLANKNGSNLNHWVNIAGDVTTLNSNFSGANSVEGAAAASAGLWDQTDLTSIYDWYKNGPTTGNTVGSAQTLFSVTYGASAGSKVVYSSIGTANLISATGGLVLAGAGTSPPPVPLPPAVWLFGTGLLGLAGVARRKSMT